MIFKILLSILMEKIFLNIHSLHALTLVLSQRERMLEGQVRVIFKFYDFLGNEIVTLINEEQQPGIYELTFDAQHYQLPSGVYFYKLKVEEFTQTHKMILMR